MFCIIWLESNALPHRYRAELYTGTDRGSDRGSHCKESLRSVSCDSPLNLK